MTDNAALNEDVMALVSTTARAISKHEMSTLAGAPPITGHGYYDPGAIAVTAVLTWLATHGDAWTSGQLLDLIRGLVRGMYVKQWAHLEGGSQHGG